MSTIFCQQVGFYNVLLREDLDQLEFMLDDWISKIPAPQPIEQGEVLLSNFRLKNYKLKKNKVSKAVSTADNITFDILNAYKRTPASVEFKSARATFQTDDKKQFVQIKLVPEAGVIQIPQMRSKQTDCGFAPDSEIAGKGILKIQLIANVNGFDKQFDESFLIEGKTKSELLFERIFWPLLILAIIVVLIAACKIIKAFMPVKITMEVVGNHSEKSRPVSMKIKKRAEFGSKAGLPFKLDGELFVPIVGQIQRTGVNKWQVIPRDNNSFENRNKKIDYVLGTALKLKTKDDATVSIRFKKVKK